MAVAISSQEAACAPSTGSKSREIEFAKYCTRAEELDESAKDNHLLTLIQLAQEPKKRTC